jgi:hypothetical protein
MRPSHPKLKSIKYFRAAKHALVSLSTTILSVSCPADWAFQSNVFAKEFAVRVLASRRGPVAGAIILLCTAVPVAGAHTPKPGSPERQAICDAARAYVLKHAIARPPQPIVFKIEHLSVTDPYCNLEAVPLLKDGSYASPKYMPDIVFNLCLKKTSGRWEVIYDLSRTDVPSGGELERIKRNFPPDFPISLLSATWQNLLGDVP